MSDTIEQIKQTLSRDSGWKEGDIEVGTVEMLDHGGCTFYRASIPTLTDAAPIEFAVLPDGRILGGEGGPSEAVAGEILSHCGDGAPADWWAQVIARFAGQGGVLVDENTGAALRKLREHGLNDPQPTLREDGSSKIVTYFGHDYQRSRTYLITATLDTTGKLSLRSEDISTLK